MDSKVKRILIVQGLSSIIAFIIWVAWIAANWHPVSQVWYPFHRLPSSPQPLPLLIWVLPILFLLAFIPFTIWGLSEYKQILIEKIIKTSEPVRKGTNPDQLVNEIDTDLELPDRQQRQEILKDLTKALTLSKDTDLNLITCTTTGFRKSDLTRLCEIASQNASKCKRQAICMHDFENALDQQFMSGKCARFVDDHTLQLLAYHEAGHILAAWLIPQAAVIQTARLLTPAKITLGSGRTESETGRVQTHGQLLANLAVLLAGRAAEEIMFGDVSSHSSNDLVQATRISHWMVARWGMGNLGPVAYDRAGLLAVSEETKAKIDKNVQRLLEERYAYVKELLVTESTQLENLSQILIEEERLDRDQITKILGERVFNAEMFNTFQPSQQS